MAESDLTHLSDGELEAAHLLLGEQAHQITLAQEKVRDEQARRRSTIDPEKHAAWADAGVSALMVAVAGAPQRAAELAKQRAERQAVIDEALTHVPSEYQAQIADQLSSIIDLTPEVVARVLAQFTVPTVEQALAQFSDDELLSVVRGRGLKVDGIAGLTTSSSSTDAQFGPEAD